MLSSNSIIRNSSSSFCSFSSFDSFKMVASLFSNWWIRSISSSILLFSRVWKWFANQIINKYYIQDYLVLQTSVPPKIPIKSHWINKKLQNKSANWTKINQNNARKCAFCISLYLFIYARFNFRRNFRNRRACVKLIK